MRFNKAGIDPEELEAFKSCGKESRGFIDVLANSDCFKQILKERAERKRINKGKPGKNRDPWANGVGERMWGMLHQMVNPSPVKLTQFIRGIPCGPCRKHFVELVKQFPAVFGEGWFEWTVMLHNAVNKSIGKPELTVQLARKRWAVKSVIS